MTLREIIRATARRFRAARLHYGHGTDNAHDEAAFLVLRALGLPFNADLSLEARRPARKRLESLIRKRIARRIPAAYLLNEAWLDGHPFYVDRRVIIPRSHIAELLRERLRPWLHGAPRRVLDLCTGSGCLAVLAAIAFPGSSIDASDISPAALAVARKNISRYRLAGRVRLLRSDLFAALEKQRYDLIVTNPPYVAARSMRRLPPEYRHEPRLALAGGRNGLDWVARILDEAPAHLRRGGLLVCEIGDHRDALERAYPDAAFIWPETRAGSEQVFILQAARTEGASQRAATLARAKR